jgi:hypothetical protein
MIHVSGGSTSDDHALAERAAHETELRDRAFHRYRQFELMIGVLQIAIVLCLGLGRDPRPAARGGWEASGRGGRALRIGDRLGRSLTLA